MSFFLFKDQDPAYFNDDTLTISTINALNIRYTLLPYIYTLFFKSHVKGGAVIRPLVFEYEI